jgi:prepilin peptidase CpaA
VLITAALLIWGAVVAWIDWRQHRIPNVLLLPVLIPEVAMLVWRGEGLLGRPLVDSAIGAVIAGALFLPGFLMRLSGGGDVKLGACCGLVLGATGSVWMVLLAALVLGLMSAWATWAHRRGRAAPARVAAGPALVLGFASVVLAPFAGIAL